MNNVMIDLETMGLTPDAAIVSIGAVFFDPEKGELGETFYCELDWRNQERLIDEGTKDWWRKQNSKVREALKGSVKRDVALMVFDNYLKSNVTGNLKPWGNGATFDISILENAFGQMGRKTPWEFWDIRDFRTLRDLYESAGYEFEFEFKRCKHNALDDAIYQAECANVMWSTLTI